MRIIAALAAALVLGACASTPSNNLATAVGAGNAAALEAAVACDYSEALRRARAEESSQRPEVQLFSQFTQAAIYSETGEPASAAAAVDTATADPAMNPNGVSRSEMQQGADTLLQTIRDRRMAATGRPGC